MAKRSSSSFECYKKALSYFMPLCLASTWNVMNNIRNPTRSVLDLDLLLVVKKNVKKKEACKQERKSITSMSSHLRHKSLPAKSMHFKDAKTVSTNQQKVSLCSFKVYMVPAVFYGYQYQYPVTWLALNRPFKRAKTNDGAVIVALS